MIPVPKTLDQVRDRWVREDREPNERKTIEVALVLRATTKEAAADELVALADQLRKDGRDGFVGYVGHGVGRNFTTAYAALDLKS